MASVVWLLQEWVAQREQCLEMKLGLVWAVDSARILLTWSQTASVLICCFFFFIYFISPHFSALTTSFSLCLSVSSPVMAELTFTRRPQQGSQKVTVIKLDTPLKAVSFTDTYKWIGHVTTVAQCQCFFSTCKLTRRRWNYSSEDTGIYYSTAWYEVTTAHANFPYNSHVQISTVLFHLFCADHENMLCFQDNSSFVSLEDVLVSKWMTNLSSSLHVVPMMVTGCSSEETWKSLLPEKRLGF